MVHFCSMGPIHTSTQILHCLLFPYHQIVDRGINLRVLADKDNKKRNRKQGWEQKKAHCKM
jgi:hypothetical protein